MNAYRRGKARARDEAIEWQATTASEPMSYGELAWWGDYFYTLGKRYGLLREFRENCII